MGPSIDLRVYGREPVKWNRDESLELNDDYLLRLPLSNTSAIDPDSVQSIFNEMRFIRTENNGALLAFRGIILEKRSVEIDQGSDSTAEQWKVKGVRTSTKKLDAVAELQLSNVDLIEAVLTFKGIGDIVRLRDVIADPTSLPGILNKGLPPVLTHQYSDAVRSLTVNAWPTWVIGAVAIGAVAGAVLCIVTDVEFEHGDTKFSC